MCLKKMDSAGIHPIFSETEGMRGRVAFTNTLKNVG